MRHPELRRARIGAVGGLPYAAGVGWMADGNHYSIGADNVTAAELDDFARRHSVAVFNDWPRLWAEEGWPQTLRLTFTAAADVPPPSPYYTSDGRLKPLMFSSLSSHVRPDREKK